MSTDLAGRKLRFNAGKYEDGVIQTIILLQYSLGALAVVIAAGWLFFSLNIVMDPDRTLMELWGGIPLAISLSVAAYSLDYLYD